jgi:transposase
MVQKDKETIKNAAKMLNIKESTAKLIVSRFRTSGTVFKTKEERISMIKS